MNPDAARIATRLGAELEVFKEFHSTLKDEQAALIHSKADGLLQLAARKSELYQQLSDFGNERDRLLSAAGFEANATGMRGWFDALGVDSATRKRWDQLLELARDAEQLNQSNGTLIETHLRHNQQVLAVLHAAANPGSLYGRNGQLRASGTGHTRDKA